MSAYLVAKKHIPDMLKEHGPLPKFRIAEMLGLKDGKAVGQAIGQLLRAGCVKRLGRADENGLTEFKANAIMFALPEWKPPSKAPVSDPDAIAGGQYRWPTKPEYKQIRFPSKANRGSVL